MKILHVLGSSVYSGAENVVIQIIKYIREKNDDVVFGYASLNGSINNVLKSENIDYYSMASLSKKELKKVISEFKPDLIHAHDVKASLISSFTGIPCISHLHNNDPKMKVFSLKSFLYSIRMNKFIDILSVSDSVWNEFRFKKRCRKQFINVLNPINTSMIISKAHEYKYDIFYDIVFVGRLTIQKNPVHFIEIISKLCIKKHDLKVAIIGDGEMREEVNNKIIELNLQNNITLLGFVENPYPIINNCKVLCMTSSWEGFGLVAVEALALSLPVVCYNVGGLHHIVNDECGLLCTNDVEMLTEISKLLEDIQYYSNKSNNAYKRSLALDNTKEYFGFILSLYKKSR